MYVVLYFSDYSMASLKSEVHLLRNYYNYLFPVLMFCKLKNWFCLWVHGLHSGYDYSSSYILIHCYSMPFIQLDKCVLLPYHTVNVQSRHKSLELDNCPSSVCALLFKVPLFILKRINSWLEESGSLNIAWNTRRF